ncbi:MAG: cobalamin-dependent protein [Magnetococcales bacterium]|nr:cobalamin-dependent protein [Magnetococcales bacterium]
MNILFVSSQQFFAEPIGILQLSAICKQLGHQTRLFVITRSTLVQDLEEFRPDVIGYGTMSANAGLFLEADRVVQRYIDCWDMRIYRIMGGPHPTYFPEVFTQMSLDAIVQEGDDYALPKLLQRIQEGIDLSGIPSAFIKNLRDPIPHDPQ